MGRSLDASQPHYWAKDTVLRSLHALCSHRCHITERPKLWGWTTSQRLPGMGVGERRTTMGDRKVFWEEMGLFRIKTVLVAT